MQPLVEAGRRLDERYRLDDLLRERSGTALWRGTDEVLDRAVAVAVRSGLTRAEVKALGEAAARAGQVPDARWVRVLDVGSEPVERRQRAWVVTEWVEAPSLATLLRQEPLRAPVATTVVRSCAQAVAAAHACGTRHERLHPGEVLLPADGNVRLAGLELSRALDGSAPAATGYDDLRGLGGLLYACLTGRWPLPGWTGLPAPRRGDGGHPRQQRGGISRELDEITVRALDGGYRDAASLARDLAALPQEPLNPAPVDPDEHRNRRWRRVAWWVLPPVAVAGVGLGAWTLGSDLGRVPSPARAASARFPRPPQPGAGHHRVVWSTPPRIISVDPTGANAEDPGGVGLAVDDDPSTQWTTDAFRDGSHLGGPDGGVGLLLDLGRPTRVRIAQLLLSAPGATVQVRAGATAPHQASDLPVVSSRAGVPAATRLRFAHPVRARYWLVWFTTLPKAGNVYRLGVAEIALQR